MNELLLKIEQCLSDILQSGLNTRASILAKDIESYAKECESIGLHKGAILLNELYESLNLRAHSLEKDDLKITSKICTIVYYIQLCKEKVQEDLIEKSWL